MSGTAGRAALIPPRERTRVGFLGAGRIGLPMVSRLVGAGHRVQVCDRSGKARTALEKAGAGSSADPAEVAADAHAVVVCVRTDEQVREAVLGGGLLDVMSSGSVLIVHTTGSPATVARLAERARPRGIEVVDAPVSGGPHDITAGGVTLYCGATAEGMERARCVLSSYGEPILHCGPPGTGQLVKLVNNAVFAANIAVLATAVRLARGLGLEECSVLIGLGHGSAASRALSGAAARGSVAAFAHGVGEFVGKDIAVVRDVAAELGQELGLLADAHSVLGDLLTPEHRAPLTGSSAVAGS
ncbi:NAD(P)-dependent oxidoreductase [Streptomyces sp. NPDC097610]|uniref:NAD(P)-dependent oxidoreductase n=1 Tax=Streptomyces sp. NPDC097610 TaxID=3157227 RepID=UPI003316EC20